MDINLNVGRMSSFEKSIIEIISLFNKKLETMLHNSNLVIP